MIKKIFFGKPMYNKIWNAPVIGALVGLNFFAMLLLTSISVFVILGEIKLGVQVSTIFPLQLIKYFIIGTFFLMTNLNNKYKVDEVPIIEIIKYINTLLSLLWGFAFNVLPVVIIIAIFTYRVPDYLKNQWKDFFIKKVKRLYVILFNKLQHR